jgi:hypothetical protein
VIFKRRRLPAELRPPLVEDERVVAWARVTEHAAVVATNLGVFLPGRATRLGWHEIHKAVWTGRELVITPATVVEQRQEYAVVTDAAPLAVTLPEPGELPHVVRTRVTGSVSFSSHQPVPGGGVRVVARKVPSMDGLRWAARYDEGTDPFAPAVQDATAQLVASFAASVHDPSL